MLEVKTTGNVGTCRLVTAAGKTPVLNISLATNRKVGDREFTDWSSVKIWGERGQKLAPFITKGTKLLISGRPEARAYKGNDGLAKAELVIHASDVEFLSGQGQHNAAESESQHTEEEAELPLETAAA
jgi:single-strand DNA-binding protein